MRDIVETIQAMLNDNRFMDSHAVLSAAANEIIHLRCEIERLEQELIDDNT